MSNKCQVKQIYRGMENLLCWACPEQIFSDFHATNYELGNQNFFQCKQTGGECE